MSRAGRAPAPVGVGVVALLTVLLVLCLSIFSVLCLSTAQADLRLSRTNADTVSAYYAADAQAARLYAAFAAGEEESLETTLPVSGTQALYLRLARREGGVVVEAWQLVSTQDPGGGAGYLLLYTGEDPDAHTSTPGG